GAAVCRLPSPALASLGHPLPALRGEGERLAGTRVPKHDAGPSHPPSKIQQGGTPMKLVRFGTAGKERPGIIDKTGKIRDLSKVVKDIDGDALSPAGLAKIKKANIDKLLLVKGNPRLGPCVARPSNFIAIGLNYADHAAEAGMQLPPEPIIFNKALSCICGPNDNTITPKDSTKLDYEVELGIVIGKRASYLSKENAMSAVAGYCL